MNGFLGDQVSCLPVLRWIKETKNKRLSVLINKNFSFIYEDTFLFDKNEILDMSKKYVFDENSFILYQFEKFSPAMKCHPTIYYPYFWIGDIMPKNYKNMPKIKNQDMSDNLYDILKEKKIDKEDLKNYIILSLGSRTESKRWNQNTLREFLVYLKNKNEKVIFIGNDETKPKKYNEYEVEEKYKSKITFDLKEFSYEGFFDFTNKLSLKDCIFLFQNCKLFISMEGGLVHLASLTDIKMIVVYSLVNPKERMPYRNNVKGYGIMPVYVEKNDPLYRGNFLNSGCRFCLTDFYIDNWE
ncbi:MAG: hypothetical protein NZZ41_08115, partial [Candidatus Dojkabacteria bacterium]|nr:hypothetical protein [Candidatus Dojkabacteria bacterium]